MHCQYGKAGDRFMILVIDSVVVYIHPFWKIVVPGRLNFNVNHDVDLLATHLRRDIFKAFYVDNYL